MTNTNFSSVHNCFPYQIQCKLDEIACENKKDQVNKIQNLQVRKNKINQLFKKQVEIGLMERCIAGYSARRGFSGKFRGLIYRIWNAIKAIFGQSDWQLTRKHLEKQLKCAPQKIKNQIKTPLKVAYKALFDKSPSLKKADDILKAMIVVNNEVSKSPALTQLALGLLKLKEIDNQARKSSQTLLSNDYKKKLKIAADKLPALKLYLASQQGTHRNLMAKINEFLNSDQIIKKVKSLITPLFIMRNSDQEPDHSLFDDLSADDTGLIDDHLAEDDLGFHPETASVTGENDIDQDFELALALQIQQSNNEEAQAEISQTDAQPPSATDERKENLRKILQKSLLGINLKNSLANLNTGLRP